MSCQVKADVQMKLVFAFVGECICVFCLRFCLRLRESSWRNVYARPGNVPMKLVFVFVGGCICVMTLVFVFVGDCICVC